MRRNTLRKRLSDARDELMRAREALRIVDEQLAFVQGVADDAELRAVVSETPLADRDHREADQDVRRLRRHRDEVAAQVAALVAEQDELLDRLLEAGGDND